MHLNVMMNENFVNQHYQGIIQKFAIIVSDVNNVRTFIR